MKDSFLFWYDRKVSSPFERAPKGCLPLGGCSVFPSGKEGNDYLIEVSHPEYKEHLLLLKTSDKADVEDWIRVLGECRKATYENAILGNALVDRLKAAGTALEKEKELAMMEAQEKAMTVNEVRQKKWELMKEHMESEAKHANELNTTLYETEALKSELDEVAKKAEEAEKLAKEEAERREQAEQALAAALSQVRFLQKTLLDREKDNPGFLDASFKRCMDTIEDFFDDDEATP